VYAVIKTGGKQERVQEGQTLAVERLGAAEGSEVTFTPVMLVDGDTVLAGPGIGASLVAARVVGESKGPKIHGFTYKNKSRGRKSWGHRQHYTTIEITAITATAGTATAGTATARTTDEG
jgi:large subunit ribosomal protein L21